MFPGRDRSRSQTISEDSSKHCRNALSHPGPKHAGRLKKVLFCYLKKKKKIMWVSFEDSQQGKLSYLILVVKWLTLVMVKWLFLLEEFIRLL